jgi:O-antigen/teichoic acid export membrane protein
MYVLSCWAQRHQWLARIIIVLASCLLFFIAWIAGGILELSGYVLSPLWLWGLLIISLTAITFYPSYRQQKKVTYAYRKGLDTLLTLCSCCIILCFSNQSSKNVTHQAYHQNYLYPAAAAFHKPPVKPSLKQQKQWLKKWVRTAKAYYKMANKKERAGLIILAVLLGLVLTFLVVALSCSVACNGSAVAALAVLLLGLTGIFFLIRGIIRSIKNPKKDRNPKPVSGAI